MKLHISLGNFQMDMECCYAEAVAERAVISVWDETGWCGQRALLNALAAAMNDEGDIVVDVPETGVGA